MKIKYYEDKTSINVELYKDSDEKVFRLIADELSKKFKVKWIEKIDGFDQRYWDFRFKGILLTLHLEHYLGIMIFAIRSEPDIQKATDLFSEANDTFMRLGARLDLYKLKIISQ